MRVALADDSALFRSGLALLLQSIGIEVVVEARHGKELLARIEHTAVEVAIIDIRMPPTFSDEGVQTATQLRSRRPDIAILVLSTYAEVAYAVPLLALPGSHAGIGYLLKDWVSDVGYLREALDRLAAGELLVDPGIAAQLMTRTDRLAGLTGQERRVLQEMAEGRSNTGIARRLHLSVKTVEDYCAKVFAKLKIQADPDVNRRVNAVIAYLRQQNNL